MCWQWPAVTWVDSIRSFICAVVIREKVGEERYLFWEACTSLLSFESNKGWCWQEDRLEIKNCMSLLDKGSSKNSQTHKHCHNIFCHCCGGSESKLSFWGKFCFPVALKFSSHSPVKHLIHFFHCPEALSPFFLMITYRFPKSHLLFFPKRWEHFFFPKTI